ncbi:MAG: acyl-CoA thioesterase [Deltaproteobacteria bacterium]|nr:acyl-CoA thioesterase [Deltaproteobacteria bacterium]MBW1795483.1 acyl-CoA thioesterase [Deltaproteobacteria bacterium]
MTSFKTRRVIRLKDIDAAGVIFFVNYFVFAHDTYELFLEEIGYSLRRIIEQESFLLPIVHAKSDYHQMIKLEDEITIVLNVNKIGRTSFTLVYDYFLENQELVGSVKTVHVCVDKTTLKKRPIPEEMRQALEQYEKWS